MNEQNEQEVLPEELDPNKSYRYEFSITQEGEPEIKYYKCEDD